jgi:predicted signal transduction protein with EAL and GGDEF domain
LLIKACEAAFGWPSGVRVAVKLSPWQIRSRLLFETVANALVVSGLAPDRLQIEVTEGLVIRDERVFFELTRLRSLGIHILMDDFGVGYSSLSYFQPFSFAMVKLDRSFVTEAATSKAANAIILAVVQLGKALGMGVVAEGVETQQQMEAVVAAGCTHIQGICSTAPSRPPTCSHGCGPSKCPKRLL